MDWPRRTERLLIRPATIADVDACWAFRRLPEVAEWVTTAFADQEAFAAWMAEPANLERQLVVEVDGRVVGDAMVDVRSPWAQTEVRDEAEGVEAALGWTIDPAHQGQGLATELAAELLVVAFAELGLRRVIAECFADNVASWRVMEKVGMRREAHTVRESLHRDRGWLDGLTYALLADEWTEGPPSSPARPSSARPSLADVGWPRRTERLVIRPATADDAVAVWRFTRLPEVTEWEPTRDVDEEAFTARYTDPAKLPVRLVAELDGTVVGDLMLRVQDGLAQVEVTEQAQGVEAEVGWSIDPAVQGRGLGTEAAAELLAIAFDELGLRRVVAGTFAENVPSWRLMERIGMRRELDAREEALHRSRGWRDGYQYALLASEHASRRAASSKT